MLGIWTQVSCLHNSHTHWAIFPALIFSFLTYYFTSQQKNSFYTWKREAIIQLIFDCLVDDSQYAKRITKANTYIFKTALWGNHGLSQSPGKLHVSGLGLARQTVGVRTGGRGWSRSAQVVRWFEYFLYNFLVLWRRIADSSMDGDRHTHTRVCMMRKEKGTCARQLMNYISVIVSVCCFPFLTSWSWV